MISAPLRSLLSFAIAHRRTPVRLSLVVELSCRVQIFAQLKNKKTALTDGFCFWQGQKDDLRSASFTALIRYRSPAHSRAPFACSRTLLPSSNLRPAQKQKTALTDGFCFWQGQKDSNSRHSVLETDALPTELYP